MTDVTILSKELLKARKRLTEQSQVVSSCMDIISSPLTLPSLKRIASARLPKLQATLRDTTAVVAELEAVLAVPIQTDIEAVAPPSPLTRTSKPR